jgi:hypothetical protein
MFLRDLGVDRSLQESDVRPELNWFMRESSRKLSEYDDHLSVSIQCGELLDQNNYY